MEQLLEITRVPYEFQMKVKGGTLEYKRGTVEMEVSRSDTGGLDIKGRPIQVQVDTYEARNSLRPTTMRSNEQNAEMARNAAYEATAVYASHGQLFMNAKVGEDVMNQIAAEQTNEQIAPKQAGIDFLPDAGAEIDWQEGDLQIRYDMEKLNFDWKIERPEFKFTPPDIEMEFTAGKLNIKYMGGFMYVPASADPNYKPVDVRA